MTSPRFVPTARSRLIRHSDARASSLRIAGMVVLAAASGLACTAIFKPRDSVQRCGSADDCDATGDNRYDAVCRFDPDNVDLDSTKVDKICVADFKVNIGCNPDNYTLPEHPFTEAIKDCRGPAACDMDKWGTLGCVPVEDGGCLNGLDIQNNICVDNDSDERIVSSQSFVGQDVKDQFCKSFFCDDTFVCDASDEERQLCVRCDPDKGFGEGGCGLLYKNGAPSPIYVLGDDLDADCAHDKADVDEPLFGPCMDST